MGKFKIKGDIMKHNLKLQDKVCIVTGGASGIGKKISEYFLNEGAIVNIIDINEDVALNTINEFKKKFKTKNIFFYKGSVTEENLIENIIDSIIKTHNKIDILVNNAGITSDNLVLRMSLEQFKKVIDINLVGAFICSKYVLKYMFKNKSGKIINISSIVGLHGNAGQSNYAASKAGLIGLTKALAKEFSSRNITVNAIAPGYIETEMTQKLPQDIKSKLIDAIPSGKLGLPEDVAKAALFLASDDSDYITGTVLSVDGGMGI